jgi:hypothetical protein
MSGRTMEPIPVPAPTLKPNETVVPYTPMVYQGPAPGALPPSTGTLENLICGSSISLLQAAKFSFCCFSGFKLNQISIYWREAFSNSTFRCFCLKVHAVLASGAFAAAVGERCFRGVLRPELPRWLSCAIRTPHCDFLQNSHTYI